MRPIVLALALPLVGCVGPAASLTANGALVGADTSAAAILGAGTQATAFLAVPRDLSDLPSNIVDDADRVWIAQNGAETDLANEGEGIYASAALTYVPDVTYSLWARVDGEDHQVMVEAPEAPDLVFDAAHAPYTPFSVDLSGQGFDYASGFVVNTRGEVTWDSRPPSDADLIEELRDADGVDSLEIPASAFPGGGGTYIVAVGGFVKATPADYDGFGTFLSTFAAGKFGTAGLTVR